MGALNKWVSGLVINTETLRHRLSDTGRKPDRGQGAMKGRALTTAAFFVHYGNDNEGTRWRNRFKRIKESSDKH